MDKEAILSLLESCLLSDEEMDLGPEGWEEFEDPFEHWEIMSYYESDEESEEDEDENEDKEGEENHPHGHSHAHGHGHSH